MKRLLLSLLLFVNAAFAIEYQRVEMVTITPSVWYRGDTGVTLSSGLVSTWVDQSGNGRNATAAGAAQPTPTRTDNKENRDINTEAPSLWGGTRGGWVDANVTAPDGTSTADLWVATAVNDSHYFSEATSCAVGTTIRASVYAKKKDRDWVVLYIYDGAAYKGSWFNINTGRR